MTTAAADTPPNGDINDGNASNDDDSCSTDSSLFSTVVANDSSFDGSSSFDLSDLGSSFTNSDSWATMDRDGDRVMVGLPPPIGTAGASGMSIPTYHPGEYEDERAELLMKLMENHASIVTTSLVERSNIIKSVTWLSRHVPESVFRTLFESILRSRKVRAREKTRQKEREGRDRMKLQQRRRRTSSLSTEASEILPQRTVSECGGSDESADQNGRDKSLGLSKDDWIGMESHTPVRFDPKVSHASSLLERKRSSGSSATRGMERKESTGSEMKDAKFNINNLIPSSTPSNFNQQSPSCMLPIMKKHDSALLFVDISGFTKISVTLDVESLSNAINSYFEMIVNEVSNFGGDVLKFAGDAIFAEWKVSRRNRHHNLGHCVTVAARCAAAIVANCSDYAILSRPTGSRRGSLLEKRGSTRASFFRGASSTTIISEDVAESLLSENSESAEGGVHQKSTDFLKIGDPKILARKKSGEYKSGNGKSAPLESKPTTSRECILSRRESVRRRRHGGINQEVATLNVKCGLGAGHIVGIHVGDDTSRREYLILGDPINQVAKAESVASHGEVYASLEAVKYLQQEGEFPLKNTDDTKDGQPIRIADCSSNIDLEATRRRSSMSTEVGTMLGKLDELDSTELRWLKRMISLYVHPVVVNDENERTIPIKQGTDHERHISEAELRNVYTCFITPLIDSRLTGDRAKDQKLFNLLNDIMNTTTRELGKVQGHLRQFILDDKGLVLICTFGLRGSTFPNMIAQRAVPFSLAIQKAFEEELGVKCTMGATFGKVYCGVVGGLERHEFAVLGPSVNLSARLMSSKDNPGILVDKNVRLLSSQVFFKPLPAVKAKGYDEPVPIFEPIRITSDSKWGHGKKTQKFVGREAEIKKVMGVAKDVLISMSSKMLFITAASGTGKSCFIVQSMQHIRAMTKMMRKKVIVARNVSRDGDSRIPFSLFRTIFKDILAQIEHDDETSLQGSVDGSKISLRGHSEHTREFSISGQWDSLSIQTQSTNNSTMSTDATRFRFICQELNAPPEFMEVVGRRLLGLRERSADNPATNAKGLNLQKIVDFLADAFVRCTKHAHLVVLTLDDVQWMDDMSWKTAQAIFERAENVFILCGSRTSNLSTVDPAFWSDLQGQFRTEGRFHELSLLPFGGSEVTEMIAKTLSFDVDEVDQSFSRHVAMTTGGMPHYLTYILDTIKRNNLTVRLGNGMVGMQNLEEKKLGFGSVGDLLLHRLDALDSSVRFVLHLSAILGTEFDLLDATLAYEEMFGVEDDKRLETARKLREAFDVAVQEGVIEQSFIFEDEDDDYEFEEKTDDDPDNVVQPSLGNIVISLKGRKAHPFYAENCRLRFTHDSWKSSILNVMLDERKQEMHSHVALSLEKELSTDNAHNKEDFGKQIRVFKHWKLSGDFSKSAQLGLTIGSQLMMLGLNTQALPFFDDVLNIMKQTDDNNQLEIKHGGIGESVLNAIGASELEDLIKLNIAKGKANTTLRKATEGAGAYQDALDILNHTPSAFNEGFDRSVSFPIFSGLFTVLKMGAIEQDEDCSYEKELCKKFVEQARLNGDPVHYGRALAMEAETSARLGNFEKALEVVEQIQSIYDIETQHAAVCKAYASDRVAQAFTHRVNFNNALGRTEEALRACHYVVEEIVPKSDPKNVHNTFCLVYGVVMFMKENGLALDASDLFKKRVIEPFEEHFGPGGSTYSKPMFKPILVLLDLQGREDLGDEMIDEWTYWALDDENFEGEKKLAATPEGVWAAFAASSITVMGEICYELAKRQHVLEKRTMLLEKALRLMEQAVVSTSSLPYANTYARKKLDAIKNLIRAC